MAAKGHVILIGYGRVGSLIAAELKKRGQSFVVIEYQADMARRADNDDIHVLPAHAADEPTLENAGSTEDSTFLTGSPEGFEAAATFQRAQEVNPAPRVTGRAPPDADVPPPERLRLPRLLTAEHE